MPGGTHYSVTALSNERANATAEELKGLKRLAVERLGYPMIATAEAAFELIELVDEDDGEEEDCDA